MLKYIKISTKEPPKQRKHKKPDKKHRKKLETNKKHKNQPRKKNENIK